METAALVLAAAALVAAVAALVRAGDALGQARAVRREALAGDGLVEKDLRGELTLQRQLLLRLVRGERVTPEMVREGILWREVNDAEGRRMVAEDAPILIDVRTPEETAQGLIPGALLIPMDEIEERLPEIPRVGRPLLVYCEGGVRSAAVCGFLAREGFEKLYNLSCGIAKWTGAVARPT